ncbi:MAG: S-layer homology domain-containing protein, partial [Lachnospiraceae bacterium]|nr:S-layer homology domain-containing protein [Lachnospiraceae bacterium]
IDYGGSSDPFDELRHCVCFDDDTVIIGDYKGTADVPDSVVDKSDGFADTESFVTRAEAVQALYEAVGSPAVKGRSRFTDVPKSASYAKAVKWGEDNKICFGWPRISSDTFCPDELISRQDFALMAHRYADLLGFGTAFDYGRTDWFEDFHDIDFYAWGPFTWAIQWRVLGCDTEKNICYPHGRLKASELKAGIAEIFDLDEGASYSGLVDGNGGNPNE